MQLPPPPPKAPEWSTRIPSRRPEFKFHKNRGQALNAVTGAGSGTVYKLVDGEWEVIWDGPVKSHYYGSRNDRPTVCEVCGGSTINSYTDEQIRRFGTDFCNRNRQNMGSYEWRRSPTNKSKIVEPLERVWTCGRCR